MQKIIEAENSDLFDVLAYVAKLTPLLRLKYNNAISDAVADLGGTAQIRTMFAGFQKYLYLDNEGAGYEI
jgi:hypothetical protein